ncbi:hypothetical protein Tsubulata_028371 [Turnera subulata]|uniref:Uncharacterized protein n=1 Tax=Turnera subulata TaxID=218843 RepID=A0A9Q0FF95_9ROSI|nr:hypothetical protein Tsubulata_028371 [Turnera subulata]
MYSFPLLLLVLAGISEGEQKVARIGLYVVYLELKPSGVLSWNFALSGSHTQLLAVLLKLQGGMGHLKEKKHAGGVRAEETTHVSARIQDVMYLSNFDKEKMFMPGVFDLNSAQSGTDSLQEVIKETMLKQEVTFRKQVCELHRLYGIQASLMEDINRHEYGGYQSWDANKQSSVLPLTNPTRCEPLIDGAGFSSVTKMHTSFVTHDLLESREEACCRLQQRSFDLKLSADDFISNVQEDLPEDGICWDDFNEPLDSRLSPSGINCSETDKLKLSVSTGEDSRRIEGAMGTWFHEETHSSRNLIDLEEPVHKASEGYPRFLQPVSYAAPETYAKDKHKSHVSSLSNLFISNNVEKSPCHGIAESAPLKHQSKHFQENTSSTEGTRKCRDGICCFEPSANLQHCTSHQGDLDLNKVQDDDFSSPLNDPTSSASSAGGSGAAVDCCQDGTCAITSWTKKVDSCSNGISDVLPHEKSADFVVLDLNSENQISTDIWFRKSKYDERTSDIVGQELPRPQVGNEEPKDDVQLDGKRADSFHNSSSDLVCLATREASCEKSEVEDTVVSGSDQSQNTFQDQNGNNSPASWKSCISDNDSSSIRTMQSDTISNGLHDKHSKAPLVSRVLTYEDDQGTSDGNDLRGKCDKEEESAEVDVLMQGAAESLINMSSMEISATLSKEVQNEEREQPQYSFDSFELMTMNLTQTNEDDNCVSSRPYEVIDAEMKDFSSKLRRGRRMKDFQKEILPSLSSLSRLEIREDINIMEGVLRSREYRKMRAKMLTNGDNCSAMVRNRRSRLSCTGRRNLSWKFG